MVVVKDGFSQLEEWLRNRLRYCIWRNWKKLERKRKNPIRLAMDHTTPMHGVVQEWTAGQ